MKLLILSDGTVRCLYGEAIELASLGSATITRASHVEPDGKRGWLVDLSPVGGPVLHDFATRSQALAAEQAWLEANWLQ